MKVLIRLKSTSQRIELEAKNAYAKSGFYCVYRTDGTVLKYPVADLFDVELHPGMLVARNTPALMKVAIHLKGTHLPIELEADSTEHNAEFFTAKMPSSALKIYPMANIQYVAEDYQAEVQHRPVNRDSGPLEAGDTGVTESTRMAMTREGPITLKIETPVKQSKIGDDFKYLLGLIEIVGRDIQDPKPNCSADHMLRLCEEGAAGLDKYPEDKLSRWLGFCSGVLQFHEIGCELTSWEGYGSLKHDVGTIKPNEIEVMRQLFIRYNKMANAYSETDARVSYAATRCLMVLNHLLSFNLNQVSAELGLVQGMLAAAGAIDVDTEREYTRPFLHSLHDGPVPSFPTA
ncbi:hypothetical protein [Pseudomonas sp. PLMAX]|uniref:hypothetical protein n=1 Tax=Pseudomonas sp. PLMAX TaxID=2201998 RepID=UPI0038BDE4FC